MISITGVYTCVASTDTGSDTDSGTLEVIGIPAQATDKMPYDMTILEGTEITVFCTVTGYPLPTHQWFKVKYLKKTQLIMRIK